MIRNFLIILLFLIISFSVSAQEYLTGLSGNPVLKHHAENNHIHWHSKSLKSSKIEFRKPVTIPFFEDFKQKDFYPDTARWLDNYVFVNQEFPLFPPSWGAATFDAVDAYGDIYSNANSLQFFADQLTSRPIRLDSVFDPSPQALSSADSVYLSFYYQPQGIGNDPQPQDSLVLQFGFETGNYIFDRVDSSAFPVDIYGVDTIFPGDTLITPCDPNWGFRVLDTLFAGDTVVLPCDSVFFPERQWYHAWSSKGMALDTFRLFNDTFYFKQVFVPIKDSVWFRKDFHFRFYNYASIANDNLQSWQSNCDYWNVDYILLDRNRSRQDTTHQDITFVGRAESFLKNYQSMPVDHYMDDNTNLLKPDLKMYISNLDDGNQTANYGYDVYDLTGDQMFGWDGGAGDLVPFNESGYSTIPPFAFPPVNGFFFIPGDRDYFYYDIIHHLTGDQALGLEDTLTFRQEFDNYFAYDDGTPEFGFGLTPAGAQLAYQYNMEFGDTLRAVNIFFNKTLNGANQQFFNLSVWSHDDIQNEPGDLLWQDREKPVFEDGLYEFHTYHFDSPVYVNTNELDTSRCNYPIVTKTFYIGWVQTTGHNLNVGFDANNDSRSKIYYLVTSDSIWEKSNFEGSLMMRPVVGRPLLEETQTPAYKSSSMDLFRIAPNPSNDGLISLKFMKYPGYSQLPEFVTLKQEVLQNMDVYVFNMMGQMVYQGNYESVINLSFLHDGIYVIRIIDKVNNISMSQKLLIRN